MKTLMQKCLLALMLALGGGYALANDDWYQFDDPVSGGTWWCQASTGVCILLDSAGPIDP